MSCSLKWRRPSVRFETSRENLGQYVVEALALFEARAENFSRARELLVRKLLDLRFERIYYLRLFLIFRDGPVVRVKAERLYHSVEKSH